MNHGFCQMSFSSILLLTHKGVGGKTTDTPSNCWHECKKGRKTWLGTPDTIVCHQKRWEICRGVHLQRVLHSTWVTTTYSTVPRTTHCTSCCSLASVLLPAARHRWTHPCRQLYWQSQHSSPRVSADEACRGGTVRMYFILPLCNNSPFYPCWSTLSWGLFWKTVFFQSRHGPLILLFLLMNQRTVICIHKGTEEKATAGPDPFPFKHCYWHPLDIWLKHSNLR